MIRVDGGSPPAHQTRGESDERPPEASVETPPVAGPGRHRPRAADRPQDAPPGPADRRRPARSGEATGRPALGAGGPGARPAEPELAGAPAALLPAGRGDPARPAAARQRRGTGDA